MTYINYLYSRSSLHFVMLVDLFINYLECLSFSMPYKKKFIYTTILTNLTHYVIGFSVYKISLTYASFCPTI